MKALIIGAALALFTVSAPAQQAASQKSAGLGKTQPSTNEELNIRAYIELLRTDIRNGKTQLMGEVMQLDADESAKFWPIYKQFETEFSALGDKVMGLVKEYALNYDKMTDQVADHLGKQVLSIEQQRNELKAKYYEKIKAATGAILAVRFLQIENQLERLVALQIAAELPVVTANK